MNDEIQKQLEYNIPYAFVEKLKDVAIENICIGITSYIEDSVVSARLPKTIVDSIRDIADEQGQLNFEQVDNYWTTAQGILSRFVAEKVYNELPTVLIQEYIGNFGQFPNVRSTLNLNAPTVIGRLRQLQKSVVTWEAHHWYLLLPKDDPRPFVMRRATIELTECFYVVIDGLIGKWESESICNSTHAVTFAHHQLATVLERYETYYDCEIANPYDVFKNALELAYHVDAQTDSNPVDSTFFHDNVLALQRAVKDIWGTSHWDLYFRSLGTNEEINAVASGLNKRFIEALDELETLYYKEHMFDHENAYIHVVNKLSKFREKHKDYGTLRGKEDYDGEAINRFLRQRIKSLYEGLESGGDGRVSIYVLQERIEKLIFEVRDSWTGSNFALWTPKPEEEGDQMIEAADELNKKFISALKSLWINHDDNPDTLNTADKAWNFIESCLKETRKKWSSLQADTVKLTVAVKPYIESLYEVAEKPNHDV